MIFPDNTRKTIFQRDFFGNTIYSGRLKKENMVFCAVMKILDCKTNIQKDVSVLIFFYLESGSEPVNIYVIGFLINGK